MAKNAVTSNTSKVEMLDLARIDVPWSWNGRSAFADDTTSDEGKETVDTGNRGWEGIMYDIAQKRIAGEGEGGSGIEKPCLVRPNPLLGKTVNGVKQTKEYSLVQGFTRVKCLLEICSGDAIERLADNKRGGLTQKQASGLKTSKILVPVVVQKMSEAEAVALNYSENLLRNDLTPKEKAFAVVRIRDANPGITDTALAIQLNMNQPYVTRIRTFTDQLKGVTLPAGWKAKDEPAAPLLEAWRQDVKGPGPWEMLGIATSTGDKAAAYLKATDRKLLPGMVADKTPAKPKKAKTGPGTWLPNVIDKDVPRMATLLVALQRSGFIEFDSTPSEPKDIDALLTAAGKDPSKKSLSQDDYDNLAGAFSAAMAQAAVDAREAAKAAGAAKAAKPAADTEANGAPAVKGKGKGGKGAAAQA